MKKMQTAFDRAAGASFPAAAPHLSPTPALAAVLQCESIFPVPADSLTMQQLHEFWGHKAIPDGLLGDLPHFFSLPPPSPPLTCTCWTSGSWSC